MACSYCYARKMYKRFGWNPEIRFEPLVLSDPFCYPGPSRVFVGSTIELFGEWVKPAWLDMIFEFCQRETNKRHTFIFLTKRPEELLRWSPFPPNVWIGVSVTNQVMHNKAIACLSGIKASVKFLSYEPLLNEINFSGAYDLSEIRWVIVGAQTPYSEKTSPKMEWIKEIVEACDKVSIPVFQKNNLKSLLGDNLRQEFPKL